ncbi:MAG: nucleotidyl transferase AbiEii/AbiGii toxin family protein [Chloroflexi bacterium]|nr:nucleotidyl transferase AbiEii/AbiGii toxin family protein [Chloroflexota bacterium]
MDDSREPAGSRDHLRPLRTRLQEARRRQGAPWEIVERDYLLSWILAGISQTPPLNDKLVFKGGTALKKCYFGDYRFSEDLDFSALDGIPRGEALEPLIEQACQAAANSLDEYASTEIVSERYTEREPHPGGQEAFTIRAQFPWHNQPATRVRIEITVDEPVLRPVHLRRVSHEYGEPLSVDIQVYSLEEVVAEKLRSILQQTEIMERRGWSRSRARDYYDLWRILTEYRDSIDVHGFSALLHQKCAVRGVAFNAWGDFFSAPMLALVAGTWENSLGRLVTELPSFDTVISLLRPEVENLLN